MKKTITKLVNYEFEEGDVISNCMYNWVAVRTAGGYGWKHSNYDDGDINEYFTDEDVERMLNNETWIFMGNRVEREQARTQVNW